ITSMVYFRVHHSYPTRRSSDLMRRWSCRAWAHSRRSVPPGQRTPLLRRPPPAPTTASKAVNDETGRLTEGELVEDRWEVQYLLRSEEHTSELQSRENLVCRLLL